MLYLFSLYSCAVSLQLQPRQEGSPFGFASSITDVLDNDVSDDDVSDDDVSAEPVYENLKKKAPHKDATHTFQEVVFNYQRAQTFLQDEFNGNKSAGVLLSELSQINKQAISWCWKRVGDEGEMDLATPITINESELPHFTELLAWPITDNVVFAGREFVKAELSKLNKEKGVIKGDKAKSALKTKFKQLKPGKGKPAKKETATEVLPFDVTRWEIKTPDFKLFVSRKAELYGEEDKQRISNRLKKMVFTTVDKLEQANAYLALEKTWVESGGDFSVTVEKRDALMEEMFQNRDKLASSKAATRKKMAKDEKEALGKKACPKTVRFQEEKSGLDKKVDQLEEASNMPKKQVTLRHHLKVAGQSYTPSERAHTELAGRVAEAYAQQTFV